MPSLRTARYRFAALRSLLAGVACIGLAHAAPGDLDLAFGSAGKLITTIGGGGAVRALAVQPDGKLVAAGACLNGGSNDFCLARYNANGSPDTTFGSSGKVLTAIGSNDDSANTLMLQPDGKLVAAGYCLNGSSYDFCLARYNTNGSLDPAFGTGGKVVTAIGSGNDLAYALALQPDGKLVAAGNCYNASGTDSDFCLARYHADGSLDLAFGTGGKVVTQIGNNNDSAYAVVVQPDGKLAAAGTCITDSGFAFCLARYNANGSLDPTFGIGGKVVTAISSYNSASALAVQPDGKLVAAGACSTGSNSDFCLARYNADGSLDTGFNGSGKVVTPIGSSDDYAYALAVQPDGRLVAAGTCASSGNYDFCLARYNTNGSLDTGLNITGKVVTPIGSSHDHANALMLQPDGKLVAAGACANGNSSDFCLARYQGGPFGYRNCKLDIDGDNRVLATTDSLIHLRIALGITGSAVVNGISFPANATRTTWPLIRSYLVTQCGMAIAP